MRCLTLAENLRDGGALCRFICRNHDGNMIDEIRERGFEVNVLPLNSKNLALAASRSSNARLEHSHWLGADWVLDASQTKTAIDAIPLDWLIVDHYAIDRRWERQLRPLYRKLMVIDDLADRPHDCDLLLDQNIGRKAEDYNNLVNDACTILAGPSYALIRNEFWQSRHTGEIHNKNVKNLLVFFGGVDIENYTGRTLNILSEKEFSGLNVDVVIGARHLFGEKIKSTCKKLNFQCHVQTPNMAELMQKADLYIGAGGGAILERIMMKLPSVATAVADNQVEALKYLGNTGSSIYLGPGHLLKDNFFKQEILRAMNTIELLTKNGNALCKEYFSEQVQWSERLSIKPFE